MHDLEQRAQQLVRDWKTLRHRLEHIQPKLRQEQFYTMHLDGIEASLVDMPELVSCIVSDMSTRCEAASTAATTQPHMGTQQPPSGGGFATRIRRMRQAVEDIDMDD
jgi:hypothetical protein